MTHLTTDVTFSGQRFVILVMFFEVCNFFVERLRDFFIERLHDFLRGCKIFFHERLRDMFLCEEVA